MTIKDAELAALRAEAAADRAPPVAPAVPAAARTNEPAAPPAPTFNAEHVRTAVDWLVAQGVARRPRLAAVFTDDRKGELAKSTAAVLDKHGWKLPDWLERFRPELVMLFAWWSAIRATLAVLKASDTPPAAQPGAAAPVAPAGATVKKVAVPGAQVLKANQ